MIRIDLLPREPGAKVKTKKAGKAGGGGGGNSGSAVISLVILVAGALALGGAGYAAYTIYEDVKQTEKTLKDKETERKDLKDEAREQKQEFDQLKEKYEKAIDKARVLLMLDPPDRLIWAEKLNMLAEMRPDGIALTELELVEDVKMIETPLSRQRRQEYDNLGPKEKRGKDKPKKVEVPLITQIFTITGVAYSQQPAKRLEDITKFGNLVEEYHIDMADKSVRRFMDNFQDEITFGGLQLYEDYLKTGRDVMQFKYTLNTKAVEIKESDDILKEMLGDASRRSAQKKAAAGGGTQRTAGQLLGAQIP